MSIIVLLSAIFCAKRTLTSPVLPGVLLAPRTINVTADTPSIWVGEPNVRGTSDILYSCFSTLFLCAWTAYHPNVPSIGHGKRNFFLRILWMLLAVFIPEIVLWQAWRQYWAARALRDEVNKTGKRFESQGPDTCQLCSADRDQGQQSRDPSPSNAPNNGLSRASTEADLSPTDHHLARQDGELSNDDLVSTSGTEETNVTTGSSHASKSKDFIPWTMDQAFLVVCGGLAVDSSSWWDEPRMTFTSEGVVQLAKVGLLPKISKNDAGDRSKADIFAKLIVCTQAVWFLIQSFARVATQLPLTLLEVHTMIHIACALTMYAIWWKKPYGVESPILVEDPRVTNFATLLTVSFNPALNSQEKCALQYDANAHHLRDRGPSHSFVRSSKVQDAMRDLRERRCHISWRAGYDSEIILTPSARFMVSYNSQIEISGRIRVDRDDQLHSLNHVDVAALLFSGLYGGSHLGAWAFHFPTYVEMWIWRACGIILCTTPIVVGPSLLLSELSIDGPLEKMNKGSVISLLILPGFVFAFYPYARLFLLVESLVSLRSPANGTYETVGWTQFIPHFL